MAPTKWEAPPRGARMPAVPDPQSVLCVHAVQRFCLRDGPGIRTTVFLQGCPLRCWWCQNPETRPARSVDSRIWHAHHLVDFLERDARYWRHSGGGVTVSGGEPLMQAKAVAGLLELLGQRGHHRAVDTSGAVHRAGALAPRPSRGRPESSGSCAAIERLAPFTDLWLWDVKCIDTERYQRACGGNLEVSLGNLAWVLAQTDAPVIVRVPLIRGFNDDPRECARIGEWLASLARPVSVEVLPGHDLREGKRSGTKRRASVAPRKVIETVDTFRRAGLHVLDAAMEGAR